MVSKPSRSSDSEAGKGPENAGSEHAKPHLSAPFYGQKDLSELCSRFVMDRFDCLQFSSNSATPLSHFIAYALHRTRLPNKVTFTALYLLKRLKERFPAAKGSSGHRLFISALMIASKVVCDDTYSNKSWCIVGQNMFSLREVNQMEREMCGYLEWQLTVDEDILAQFEAAVRREYSPAREGMVSHVRKTIVKTLHTLGFKTKNTSIDIEPEEQSDPSQKEEPSILYSTSGRPDHGQDTHSEAHIYGGEFTNVHGNQTNIYVTVQNHEPPRPPPTQTSRSESPNSQTHPNHQPPHHAHCNHPPNSYSPPYPYPHHHTFIPLPPVMYSPYPYSTPIPCTPWPVPHIPYSFVHAIPYALSYVTTGWGWMWMPAHWSLPHWL